MTMDRVARMGLGLLLAVATALGLWGAPAGAQTGDVDGALVVLTGRLDVGPDDEVDVAVIFDGPAVIEGTVRETVVAFNGDVLVRGTVEDDVVSLNGRVTVEAGAQVGGDVVSSRSAVVDPAASVAGDVRPFDREAFDTRFQIVSRLALWLAVTVSTLVLGLLLVALAPRAVQSAADAARHRTGPVIGWGVLVLIVGPIVAGLVMATVVGLPLGLWALATVAVISVLGYVTGAWILGRRMLSGPGRRLLAFLAGFAVLRVLALIPIVGGLVWIASAIVGTGALAVGAWRAAQGEPSPAPATDGTAGARTTQ